MEICKKLDLPVVEVIDRGDSFTNDFDGLMDKAKGVYGVTKNPREGIVYRLSKYWDSPTCRASFKVINNEYLIQLAKKK